MREYRGQQQQQQQQQPDLMMRNTHKSFCDVVRLNNLGASFTVMKDFPSAISYLADALLITEITAQISGPSDDDYDARHGPNATKSRFFFSLDHCMAMSKIYIGEDGLYQHLRRTGDNDDTASFVFSRPIFVPEEFDEQQEEEEQPLLTSDIMCELSAVIVFNLALCYQKMGTGTTPPTTPQYCVGPQAYLLRKAISLYDLAFRLIQPLAQTRFTVFALALSNNLIHAYQALGEHDMAVQYCQFPLSFLVARSVSGWENGISNETAEFFFGTVLHLVLQRNAPAAAA
jgi:tetratricopeptide (TPR) repeat protein